MARNLAMTFVILALTGAVAEGIGSCHRARPPQDPPEDQAVDPQKPEKVKILIQKDIEPPPAPRPARPRREERPSSPQAPPAPPAPPPPLTGRTFVPTALDFLKGDRLLEGSFPRLRATYARIGFPAYRDAALALGGEFFLWDGRDNRPIARLDTRTGDMSEASITPNLSRWPRDVTKHLEQALDHGRTEFGERATHIVLLPPARLDAALLSGLDQLLQQNGVDPRSVSGFFGAYELRGERLHCVVLSTSFTDGTERPVSFSIDLGGAFL